MTLQECVALLAPLALALRAEMDEPTFRAYHLILKDVPASLGEAAIEELTKTAPRFMPGAGEILGASEAARRRLLALHAYDGCCDCEHSKGWIEEQYPDGVRARRCPCFRRHQEKLAGLGVSAQPLALPVSTSISEFTRVGED